MGISLAHERKSYFTIAFGVLLFRRLMYVIGIYFEWFCCRSATSNIITFPHYAYASKFTVPPNMGMSLLFACKALNNYHRLRVAHHLEADLNVCAEQKHTRFARPPMPCNHNVICAFFIRILWKEIFKICLWMWNWRRYPQLCPLYVMQNVD